MLPIRRFGAPGAFLATGPRSEILLLGSEIPEGAKEGDDVDVFVHLDSEARPIATTRAAKLEIGEVAFLAVTECTRFAPSSTGGSRRSSSSHSPHVARRRASASRMSSPTGKSSGLIA